MSEQTELPPDVIAALSDQRRLAELGLHDLYQRWEQQPDLQFVTVGEGAEQNTTIRGNPDSAFHGVVVYNRTGKNVVVGFNAGAAIGGQLIVPAGSILVWPAQYSNLSIGAETTGPAETVLVLRLRYPPTIASLTPIAAAKASSVTTQAADVTVKEASVQLLAANAGRRGLEVINNGAKAVRLSLGTAAVAKQGLWLAPGGGTWNGQLSGALWIGSVFAICDVGETTVALVEA